MVRTNKVGVHMEERVLKSYSFPQLVGALMCRRKRAPVQTEVGAQHHAVISEHRSTAQLKGIGSVVFLPPPPKINQFLETFRATTKQNKSEVKGNKDVFSH